jgi:methyltransferase-like protein
MDLSSKPMANPAVILREVNASEAVLVNTDTTASIVLNSSGLFAWRCMDGRHSLEAIVVVMQSQFHGVPETAIEDLRALVKTLAEEGFVGYEVLYP